MTTRDVAAAMQRVETVLRRRPGMAIHDDTTASARWQGGTRIVASHENGIQVKTDMPSEFGGAGDQVTPGWLFRAGLASCSATSIAMSAAAEGIELTALEVKATSRSDARGILGMADVAGAPVHAGPRDVKLHVRISAKDAPPERLRVLVQVAVDRSPVSCVLPNPTPMILRIDVDAS